ncbi:hypothetical protein C0971_02515 [Bacillus methanolicus]|uniref:ABC transporter permease subunit n=1 Tax=Bacillus methanolicus TaxID=1471 RepID=UPI00200BD3E1|nr:ABC transporter permease subunit [Bacillus methanolicus]UQD51023.1 hypothetical protein C0971_02515 [Bacillus methanolicus]
MRGLHLLIQNELMKIYSKKRTWFFLVSLIIFVSIAVFINYKAEPNGNWKEKAASEIQMLKKDLKNAPEDSQDVLKKDIEQLQYSLDNDINPYKKNSWTFLSLTSGIMSIITLYSIIIASGIMSSEYTDGTIKPLLTRPYSRMQILFSKYLSLIIISLTMILELSSLLNSNEENKHSSIHFKVL